jgi:hypothetical protein
LNRLFEQNRHYRIAELIDPFSEILLQRFKEVTRLPSRNLSSGQKARRRP